MKPQLSPGGGGGGARHGAGSVETGAQQLGMRQWRLVPSGIQAWNTNIIATSPTRFAYCSTLAIYVLDLDDPNVLKHLIAGHERTITGVCWHPTDPNVLATCAQDGRAVVWDLRSEERRYVQVLPCAP